MRKLLALTLCLALTACGGGGGDGGNDTNYPLKAALRAEAQQTRTHAYVVTGSCSGTAVSSSTAAVPATFEGVSGYAQASTATLNFTNCTPATSSATGISYSNADYLPIGANYPGDYYAVYESAPASVPDTVQVGDTRTIVAQTVYADSSKATVIGREVYSYAIRDAGNDADAIASLIIKSYDTSNNLLLTSQTRYRITPAGALTLLGQELQYSTTSSVHLVLTAI